MSATTTRSRQPKGVPVGGQFATETHAEATGVSLAPPDEGTVFTKRYATLDEKVEAFHEELEQQVADLADDANWQRYLDTMSRFHRYSGGGVGVFERREFSPSCANPAIEWAQSGAHIAVETLAGVSDLDAGALPPVRGHGGGLRRCREDSG